LLDDVRLCKQDFDFGDNAILQSKLGKRNQQLNNAKASRSQIADCGMLC